ncbi:hypothetical protein [Streptomyces albidoflavus]|uniref:hypothetical protein n=1 Tax=Streptomyces albidoflavus TaxID=1886 RepID=UPI0033C08DE8
MTTAPAGQTPPPLPTLGDWQPLPNPGATTTPTTKTPARANRGTTFLLTLLTLALLYTGAGGPLHYLNPNPTHQRIALYAAALTAALLLTHITLPKLRAATTRPTPPAGQIAVTIGAIVCTGVGLNTAWAFTASHLHITDTFTRAALCGTGEIVLIALGLAARDNFRRDQAAGMPGILVWIITGFLAVPAFAEGAAMATGFWEGAVAGAWRAVFGPVGAAILWHFAMGLEIKAADATARSMGVFARLGRRLGQHILTAFGLGDTDTTTTELLRQRARARAANLADRYRNLPKWAKKTPYGRWILRRLRTALRTADVASDETQRDTLLADLAVSSHAPTLAELHHTNPWGLPTANLEPVRELPAAELPATPEPTTPEVREPQPRTEVPNRAGTDDEKPANQVREPQNTLVREPQPPANQPAQRAKNQVPRTPEPRTPNLSDRAAAKKEQVQQVLNLIENRGFDAVKLALVMDETGMTKTTAYNRLTEARDLWTKRNVA